MTSTMKNGKVLSARTPKSALERVQTTLIKAVKNDKLIVHRVFRYNNNTFISGFYLLPISPSGRAFHEVKVTLKINEDAKPTGSISIVNESTGQTFVAENYTSFNRFLHAISTLKENYLVLRNAVPNKKPSKPQQQVLLAFLPLDTDYEVEVKGDKIDLHQ